MPRCPWVTDDADYIRYHDEQWGVCVFDERELFEKLCLDGQQAGLSWLTVLRKTENYRQAFCDFEPEKIVQLRPVDIKHCLNNPGLIRNRAKIHAIVQNAQAYLQVKAAGESFSQYLWSFVGGTPVTNHWQRLEDVPTQTPQSLLMAKSLKKRGFCFVGPTICYAFMQAVGMVNDHLVSCPRHQQCIKLYPPLSNNDRE